MNGIEWIKRCLEGKRDPKNYYKAETFIVMKIFPAVDTNNKLQIGLLQKQLHSGSIIQLGSKQALHPA